MKRGAAFILGLVLVGCQQKQSIQPPPVQVGQTECADCGMAVSDERYAAAMIVATPDGEETPRVFDDIGCMLEYQRGHKDEKVLASYVKDFNTRQWLDADKASYARDASVHSPMGYGIVAAASLPQAESAANGAKAMDLASLRQTGAKSPTTKSADTH
jgi:copper chaperone NosL